MEWLNDATAKKMQLSKETLKELLVSISVLTPLIANELLQTICGVVLEQCPWPTYDAALALGDQAQIVVQVNGKVRANIMVKRGATQADVEPLAREAIAKWLEGKEVVKVVLVPDRLISFVVK
jgi:leucyl-tRNA synthetase